MAFGYGSGRRFSHLARFLGPYLELADFSELLIVQGPSAEDEMSVPNSAVFYGVGAVGFREQHSLGVIGEDARNFETADGVVAPAVDVVSQKREG